MSDDFATCNNCGFFEPNTKTQEEFLREVFEEIYDYVNEIDENDEEISKQKARAFFEDYKKAIEVINDNNYLYYCKECDTWTTLSWEHKEY